MGLDLRERQAADAPPTDNMGGGNKPPALPNESQAGGEPDPVDPWQLYLGQLGRIRAQLGVSESNVMARDWEKLRNIGTFATNRRFSTVHWN